MSDQPEKQPEYSRRSSYPGPYFWETPFDEQNLRNQNPKLEMLPTVSRRPEYQN